ncbi:AAA family ATPase [Proteus mirabilis]|uniref:AAA family ATPase n=1 Tax=Proteus mirabilis TaxID=584 RepID=UPI00128EF8C2|nr:AAA family ATPase [Proteus mirabilis]MBI6252417.1 ATP-binding protein [Proteus mirabilis]MBI6289405.1 ATP-binding protein [Proteus mirabilis]MBI6345158.1 ATP-binding protein [Proteus mirabilis]MCL8549279.1 ATP-binding protein [Proteus mirabilis]MCL8563894.1 ATP-binding protein [Proteus mirabilis]
MKLLSIYIAGFQSLNRAAYVEFADGDISVIYGDNGCGKTTFLKLVHSILKRDDESLASENVMYVEIYYEKNNGEREFIPVTQIQEEVDEGIIKNSYDWSELVDSELADCTSLSLGVERGVTSESLKVEPVDILRFLGHPEYRSLFAKTDIHLFSERMAMFLKRYQNNRRRNKKDNMDLDAKHVFLQNIKMSNIENMLVERYLLARNIATERIQNALFDTLAIAVDAKKTSDDIVMPSNFENDVYKNKERIIEALDDGFENNFKNHVVNILSSIQSESDVNKILENQLLRKLVMNMTRELKVEKQLLSSINILVDVFNSFLVGDKKLIINKQEIYVQTEDSNLSIGALSSGERHILTFLSIVIIAGRGRDILLIDEPEISLNIKWQRTLLSLLQELVPETQIIVASHSPIISKKSPNSLVKLAPVKIEND